MRVRVRVRVRVRIRVRVRVSGADGGGPRGASSTAEVARRTLLGTSR